MLDNQHDSLARAYLYIYIYEIIFGVGVEKPVNGGSIAMSPMRERLTMSQHIRIPTIGSLGRETDLLNNPNDGGAESGEYAKSMSVSRT